jgi:outer membrane protein OmpA-like peptidoglycan-associated protein
MLKLLGAVSVLLFSNVAALAQVHVGHTRTPNSGSPYLSTDAPSRTESPYDLSIGARFEQTVLKFSSPGEPDVNAIEQRLISSLSARVSLIEALDVLVQGQLLSAQKGAGLSANAPLAESPTFGRTRVSLRWNNQPDADSLIWAIQSGVLSPSSSSDPLFGGPDFVPTLAVLLTQPLSTTLNWSTVVQYEHRSGRKVGQLIDAPVLSFDFATAIRLLPALEVLSEAHFNHQFAEEAMNSASVDVGARIEFSDSVALKLGISTGLLAVAGNPERSFLLSLDFMPSKKPSATDFEVISTNSAPSQARSSSTTSSPEDTVRSADGLARIVTNTDRDLDGLVDSQDACPLLPEDKDNHQDSDGCPDYDNDHDGHLDAVDESPLHPEDYDGHQDHDGRPEPDNDNDGLSDGEDRCPDHAGVGDGCPESIFDWRTHVKRPPADPPKMSVTENVIFITADTPNDDDSALRRTEVIDDIAEWLQTHHNWPRVNVMGSYCFDSERDKNESLALKRGSELTDALIALGVSSNRIGFLAVGRYPLDNDDCTVQLFIKRLQTFEGIGNQVGDIGSLDDTEEPNTKKDNGPSSNKTELLDITFVPHQDSPTVSSARLLIEFATQSRAQNQAFTIYIHTDSLGDPKSKLTLSVRRAKRLSELLLQLGVPNQLFKVIGMGSQSPVADNSTRSGRAQNNRVEVIYANSEEKMP